MEYALLAWLVISQLALIGIMGMGVYHGTNKGSDGNMRRQESDMLGFLFFSLFFLEFILFLVLFFGSLHYIGQALKWVLYGIGMLLTQTINIVTGETEE